MTLCLQAVVLADVLNFLQHVSNTDFVAAGVGGMRNVGSGTITLSGVSGPVTAAYLFWNGPTSSTSMTANASVMVNGNAVTGTFIGFASPNCWSFSNTQSYRADVTSIVAATGNGTYSLSGFGNNSTVNTNGASLVVFFQDGNAANDRDVYIFDGNDSTESSSFGAAGWSATFSGINFAGGSAVLQLHVADGQDFTDDGLLLNSVELAASGNLFQGNSVPSANNGPSNNGSLWDIVDFPITSFLTTGNNNLAFSSDSLGSDCLSLVVAIVYTSPQGPFLLGDGNGDGVTDAADLVSLLLEINDGDGNTVAAAGGGTFPGTAALDVNGDGLIDLADVRALVQKIFGP